MQTRRSFLTFLGLADAVVMSAPFILSPSKARAHPGTLNVSGCHRVRPTD